MNPFVHYENYFDKKYFALLGNRWATFKTALNLFVQRGMNVVIETGCWRFDGDVGGGESTRLFCEFLGYLGPSHYLHTVDINQKHVMECRRLTQQWPFCTTHLGDSVEFLRSWGGFIDLLYLDSYDYPYAKLMDRYGERTVETAEVLKGIGEESLVQHHYDLIGPCQEHCLQELEAALPHLRSNSVILIDDNDLPGGGKPRLAKKRLYELGWTCLLDFQQTIWIKE